MNDTTFRKDNSLLAVVCYNREPRLSRRAKKIKNKNNDNNTETLSCLNS